MVAPEGNGGDGCTCPGGGDCPPSAPTLLTACLEHSWRAFQYHADQRHRTINFFLIGFAFLVTGYGTASFGPGNHDAPQRIIVEAVICLLGALYTFAFLALDKRNEQLVHADEVALKVSEWWLSQEVAKTPEGQNGIRLLRRRDSIIKHLRDNAAQFYAQVREDGAHELDNTYDHVYRAYEIVLATEILAKLPEVPERRLGRVFLWASKKAGFSTFGSILEKFYFTIFLICLAGLSYHFGWQLIGTHIWAWIRSCLIGH